MATNKPTNRAIDLPVTFVGLPEAEQAPKFAAYALDAAGRPLKKVGGFDGKRLKLDAGGASSVAFGPDVEDFAALSKDSLVNYRVTQKLEEWQKLGVLLPEEIWRRFRLHYSCVSGTVRKCRPWYWDLFDRFDARLASPHLQLLRDKPITADLNPHILFPWNCVPLCDGIVEIYERECCCRIIVIPPLLDKLRDILERLPIPIPELPPLRKPPFPEPDPPPFLPRQLKTQVRALQKRQAPLDYSAIPPENLYEDYLALRDLPEEAAQRYVALRPYLYPLVCKCTINKVGQTTLQPGGHFDLCFLHGHVQRPGICFRTYAYKIKQYINGVLTTIYDGVAANQYFGEGVNANIRVFNPLALVCGDGPGDPPPGDGVPFIMLEHVGGFNTFHFNFPAQTGVSQFGPLDANDGSYTTGYAPDCPWGAALGLRLWFSPELEPIVKYYRLKVFAVNDAGDAVGPERVLNSTVTWDKFVTIPGDIVRAPEVLGPVAVGSETDLFHVPYWSSPDHRYLSGQFHQVWNTADTAFPDGKYMLVIEVFNAAGNRIKPTGATGPGTAQSFQFRRWASDTDTDPVPFSDAAHVFWVDNTKVGGDIVDLRKNGVANTNQCQFISGPANTTFSIGFRAFHINGVEDTGTSADDNSFMLNYSIGWQRGLNGDTGSLGAPTGLTHHTDVGEDGVAVGSGTNTFQQMLTNSADGTVLSKCTFSVSLHVRAKHFNGSGRIQSYDYHETASFALEISSSTP